MFSLSSATRIFLLPGPTDMRKSFNGLFALAQHQLGQDPQSGHLFVFCNRSRNRLKILFWDGSGLWVCAKRLEQGRFSWPANVAESAPVSTQDLTSLLDGVELKATSKKRWYRR
jgi:transposase